MRLRHGRPGGYQFVGRTLQMWSRYHEVADFAGKPWLLRFFDQLRFYPVSAEELLEIRRDFPLGRYPLRIEHSTLRLAEYQQFLAREAQSISAFRDHQQRAFNDERERWIASGQAHFDSQESATEEAGDAPLQPGNRGWKARYPAICGRCRPRPAARYAPAMCWWCLSR
ncbi:Urea carboxylase [Klebsiella quasipneumoniae]|nr:Urea carboxylase [Klebsiella quasipneumoniae]